VVTVKVPPLRDRAEDIPELVRTFLAETSGRTLAIGAGVLERLAAMPWPGNVRELRNLLTRLRIEGSGEIGLEALERAAGSGKGGDAGSFPSGLLARAPLRELKDRLEREYILHHLERLGGDTTALSRFLGLSRQQF
jgi:DNA-binding NtrC family response regulator